MRTGFVGWRGMVGSVLMDRMRADNDFSGIESVFFSTSQVGQDAPAEATEPGLLDAMSTNELASCDVIVTCQGEDIRNQCTDHFEIRDGADTGLTRRLLCECLQTV